MTPPTDATLFLLWLVLTGLIVPHLPPPSEWRIFR